MTTKLACIIILTAATAIAVCGATSPAGEAGGISSRKREVPGNDSLSQAERLVREIFAEDYRGTSPATKAILARKLLSKATTVDDDPAGLYVMLREARDLAVASRDAATTTDAITLLHASFQVPLGQQLDDWFKVAALPQAAEAHRTIAERVGSLIHTAFAADDYELAVRAAQQARNSARQSADMALAAQAEATLTRVRQLEKQHQAYRSALGQLEMDPNDKTANFTAGSFLAGINSDWGTGLSMLAKGSDVQLSELAKRDLVTPTTADEQIALADGWWELAEKQKKYQAMAEALRRRAATWYRAALPKTSGLVKEKLASRLEQVQAAGGDEATASPEANKLKVVELLPLIDVSRDALSGVWKRTADGLLNVEGNGKIRIPYKPGQEYDFAIEFTRLDGKWDVVQMLYAPANNRRFTWCMNSFGARTGFGRVGGKNVGSNPASVQGKLAIESDRRYRSVVQVRKWGVAAYLDGKLLVQYRTDFADLTPQPAWEVGPEALGVGANSRTLFHKIELTEVLPPFTPANAGARSTAREAQPKGNAEPGTNTRPSAFTKAHVQHAIEVGTLEAKKPLVPGKGLAGAAGVTVFTAPDWDQWWTGANGVFLRAGPSWKESGTVWQCGRFRVPTSAWGGVFVHPFGDGHVVVTVGGSISVRAGGRYADRLKSLPLQFADGFDAKKAFVDMDFSRQVRSELSPEGEYRLYVDGKLAASAKVEKAEPMTLSEDFAGTEKLRPALPAGYAGVIVDNGYRGKAVLADLVLSSGQGR